MPDRALIGLKVLEYGDFISAPYATKLMADLGAEVIKIEKPGIGDSARRQGPFPGDIPHPEKSGLFLFLNTNKQSLTLDPTKLAGKETFLELVKGADIVIENHPPSFLPSIGLGYQDLERINPGVILVSITPFGYDTPHAHYKSYALITSAASGLAWRMGEPGRPPLALPLAAAHYQGGIHAAASAMAALMARGFTGEGQHVWVSEVEIMGNILGGDGQEAYFFDGTERFRDGIHTPNFYPWEVAECKNGAFSVITMIQRQWDRFVEITGIEELKGNPMLASMYGASQYAYDIDELWHPWLKERTKAELWEVFRREGISFQPVLTIEEVVKADHLQRRGFWVEVEHPEAGTFTYPGAPYKLSRTPWEVAAPAPTLGQHNEEILCGRLGLSKEDLAELDRAQVI